ncbi:phosphoribosylanthranilate isomerase [Marinobacterium stanieri]|uniref:N-(5'-phosphoribosyl)anthranilate isomerase n=1 Tax=Marinobacterium stanieri TaxID=49186 RepID=A0A1N6PU87_9GAMM|nr:phosphoribosylanthranilate isomerase [Marinobacterium stanieri]SIQ07911.1 phosphoribosylanthranilate isomerase [Marinobacterium stanieri]
MSTRVKICGITNLGDALAAVEAGADALGFVFYAPSKRYVTPEQAGEIIRKLPPFVTTVGLFVNADVDFVESVLATAQLDLLQFHGDESNADCVRFGRPFIKALRVKPDLDLMQAFSAYPDARGILLDAYRPGVPGGTGEVFDWDLIPDEIAGAITLAGGLDASNVARAVAAVGPYAVDVSGGVEAAPGQKDGAKVSAFVEAAKTAA